MLDKPFNVIQASYPELYKWLKSISRYREIEKFIIPDYKNGIRINFYTKDHHYSVVAIKPEDRSKEDKERFKKEGKKDDGYLGCIALTRKPRAGEDWNRGNDLSDGSYSEETWRRIVNDIIGYELVKVVINPREKNLDK